MSTFTLPPIAPLQLGGLRERAINLMYLWNIDTLNYLSGDTILTPTIDPNEIDDGVAGKYVFPCENVSFYKRCVASAADLIGIGMPQLAEASLPLSLLLNHAFAGDASSDNVNVISGLFIGLPFRGRMVAAANKTAGLNALILTLHSKN